MLAERFLQIPKGRKRNTNDWYFDNYEILFSVQYTQIGGFIQKRREIV